MGFVLLGIAAVCAFAFIFGLLDAYCQRRLVRDVGVKRYRC